MKKQKITQWLLDNFLIRSGLFKLWFKSFLGGLLYDLELINGVYSVDEIYKKYLKMKNDLVVPPPPSKGVTD